MLKQILMHYNGYLCALSLTDLITGKYYFFLEFK